MLNPAVKADVLKVESVFQMRHELQDAFFRALFQGTEKKKNISGAVLFGANIERNLQA
jgi:hypothetical protein